LPGGIVPRAMQPHAAERRYLERQLTLARPLFLVLALLDLVVINPAPGSNVAVVFLTLYFLAAGVLAWLESLNRLTFEVPLVADLLILAGFLLITHSVAAFWYLFLFVAFSAGIRWGMKRAVILGGVVTLALLLVSALGEQMQWKQVISWVALAAGTFAAGAGFSFLGARQRRHAAEQEFLAQLSAMLRVEKGLAESLRAVLQELTQSFACELALLVFRDRDLDQLFVWKVRRGETARITPESVAPAKADAYLLDLPDASVGWNGLDGRGEGFGWDRHDARPLPEVPRPPASFLREHAVRSLLAATLEFGERPDVRVLLCNGTGEFSADDLRRLERTVRYLSAPLENLFLLRHLRARVIEGERHRISHDLHDGILQTMLGLDIRLEVLRRQLPQPSEQLAADLAALQQTVRGESGELRRMVNDLRPLRVGSADLLDMMRSFADRYRTESGIALEVITESLGLEVSDRICRELFQIYREALHNVKKHARASHVVVKLWHDEAKVSLVIDDNGQGFSFAGRFTSDELDRLRLGPISIKERTRSVGGMLTVESNPGHGARLTVEVPLN
jgi:signal transduction histidine kinase